MTDHLSPNLTTIWMLALSCRILCAHIRAWAEKACQGIGRSKSFGCSWLQTLFHLYMHNPIQCATIEMMRKFVTHGASKMPPSAHGNFLTFDICNFSRQHVMNLWTIAQGGVVRRVKTFVLNDLMLDGAAQVVVADQEHVTPEQPRLAGMITKILPTRDGESIITSHQRGFACVWSADTCFVVKFHRTRMQTPHVPKSANAMAEYRHGCLAVMFCRDGEEDTLESLHTWDIHDDRNVIRKTEMQFCTPCDVHYLQYGQHAGKIAVTHQHMLSIVDMSEETVTTHVGCSLMPSMEQYHSGMYRFHFLTQTHDGTIKSWIDNECGSLKGYVGTWKNGTASDASDRIMVSYDDTSYPLKYIDVFHHIGGCYFVCSRQSDCSFEVAFSSEFPFESKTCAFYIEPCGYLPVRHATILSDGRLVVIQNSDDDQGGSIMCVWW